MKTEIITVHNPDNKNLIFGQSHFIKTVEDLHETLASCVPGIQFGVAFAEASGDRLIRTSGTNDAMVTLARDNAMRVGCGHSFFIFLDNAFPINVLNAVKMVPEIVHVYAATANSLQIVVAQTDQGRGVLGVIDGGKPKGVETTERKAERHKFLRKIGYKL